MHSLYLREGGTALLRRGGSNHQGRFRSWQEGPKGRGLT
jgi:hypothetical protein